MSKYKNIIFDLGGVLLDIDYNRTLQAFEKLGVKNFDELYSQAKAGELFQRLEKGTIPLPEFYTTLNQIAGQNYSQKDINQAWNAMLLDFREDSLDYLEVLKPKANLILLSNTNAIHLDEFFKIYDAKSRKHGFEKYFHHCIYSFETGTRKPDAECYEWVFDHAGINPRETIFIDDSVQNIQAAKELGVESILLEKGQLIENIGLENLIG